jgi:hypothetical protein
MRFDNDPSFTEGFFCNYIGTLTNLTSLSVPGNNISHCLFLASHNSIKKLNMSDNIDINQNMINQFTNLTSLNIGTNARHISLSNLTSLTTLKIYKSISTIGPQYTGCTIIKSSNGKCYRGSAINCIPHGHGYMIYSDKSSYRGEFKNGERDGEGIFTSARGVIQTGIWKNGNINCAKTII